MSACGTENKITELKVIIWWNISNGTMDPRHWAFKLYSVYWVHRANQLASESGSNFTLVLFGNGWEHIITLANSCNNSMFKLWQFHITPVTSIMQTPSWFGFATCNMQWHSNSTASAQHQHGNRTAKAKQKYTTKTTFQWNDQRQHTCAIFPTFSSLSKNWIWTIWPY